MGSLAELPKVELHLHLDCSPSFEVVSRLDPTVTAETFARDFELRDKCRDLSDFLSRIPRLLALMQTEAALAAITRDLLRQLRADGVIYAEMRFAPLQHLQGGLSPERVVAAVDDAIAEGIAETGVECRLILCTLRHFSPEQSIRTVELARQFRDRHVAGIDLAGDEAGFPIEPHEEAFGLAERWGIHRTAHAGEAAGPESVRQTLEGLRPTRIGHGVRSIEDPAVVALVVESDVHLEVCPSCNVLIDIYDRYADHPVDRLVRAGVSLGINTDARTIPVGTLRREYQRLAEVFGWGPGDFLARNRAALRAAFLAEEKKEQLMARLEVGHESV